MQRYQSYLIVLVIMSVAGFSWAQEDPLIQALRDRIEEARNFELPENSEFVIESLVGKKISQEEIERLRRLAPTDINAKLQLDTILSQMEVGGAKSRFSVFYADEDLWRVNFDELTYSISPYVDMAHGIIGFWSLTEGQLHFASDKNGMGEDSHFHPDSRITTMKNWFGSWSTGIPWLPSAEYTIGSARFVNDHESEITVHVGSIRFVLFAILQPQVSGSTALSIRIHRVEIYPDGSTAPGIVTYDDFSPNDDVGIKLPHHILSVLPDGSVEAEYRVLQVGKLSKDIRMITKKPRPDDVDEFRGALTFRSIVDHSKGERAFIDVETRQILSRAKTGGVRWFGYRVVLVVSVIACSVFVVLLIKKL